MVSSGSRQWDDSRRPQFLALGSIRRFGNVAELVTESRLAKLPRRNVTLLPALTFGFSFILAQQPELCAWGFGKSILLANKSFVQPDQHNLFPDFASLFTDVTELQSNFAELLA
jgi:hypothetical protein